MEERRWLGSPQVLRRRDWRKVTRNSKSHFSLDLYPFLECVTLELHGVRFIHIFPFGKYYHRDPMGPKLLHQTGCIFFPPKVGLLHHRFVVSFRQVPVDPGEELLPRGGTTGLACHLC